MLALTSLRSKYVGEKLDPQYGRYMAWLLFSVGAENLAKAAACVRASSESRPPDTTGRWGLACVE